MAGQHRKQSIQQSRRRHHLQVFLCASATHSNPTIQIAQRKQTLHDIGNQRLAIGAFDQFDHVLDQTLHIEQLSRHAYPSVPRLSTTAGGRLLADQRQNLLQQLSGGSGLLETLIVRFESVAIEERAEQQQQERLDVVRAEDVVRQRLYSSRRQAKRTREHDGVENVERLQDVRQQRRVVRQRHQLLQTAEPVGLHERELAPAFGEPPPRRSL